MNLNDANANWGDYMNKTVPIKYAYPIHILPDGGSFIVTVPDLDIGTQGETLADAIEMARDAIGMWGCFELDEQRAIPEPSPLSARPAPEGAISTLVDVDFDAYRRKHETRAVRKNVTIPAWLNERAEAAHLNFSQVLQESIKERLGL